MSLKGAVGSRLALLAGSCTWGLSLFASCSGSATSPSDPAPRVGSVSPSSGTTFGGTTVTIMGGNFSAGAAVTFGELNAQPWHADSSGVWRSFKATGDGEYDLRARLLAGQLTIRSE